MKNYYTKSILFLALILSATAVFGQTSAFTYQGKLTDVGVPANGTYDFLFTLTDSGGTIILGAFNQVEDVTVTNGIFTVNLDYGATHFVSGAARNMIISVRPGASTGLFTVLSPQQAITSAPYSITSLNAATAGNVTGVVSVANGGTGGSIQNFVDLTTAQTIGGNKTFSNTLSGGVVNATTQFNIGGARVLSNPGSSNLFAGVGAGSANTSGGFNTFVGSGAGGSNTTGMNNTLVGNGANLAPGTLFNATAIGSGAGVSQSNSLVLGNNANVGIGTTAPTTKLHVSDTSNTGLRVETGMTGGSVASFGGIGSFSVDAPFIPGGRFSIGENGNIGIGTSSPTEKLHVSGGGNVRWANSHLSEQQGGSIELGGTDTIAGTGTPFIDFHFNGTAADYSVRLINDLPGRLSLGGILKTDNIVQIGNTVLGGSVPVCFDFQFVFAACGSSLRYKQNVNPFVSGLSLVKQLRPVTFEWRANGQPDMGLVAEEVAAVEPLLATTNKDGQVEGVKYDRVGVVLVNAVNEQQLQIEAQQKQIDELNAINKKQQADLDALKALVCSQNPAACKPQN